MRRYYITWGYQDILSLKVPLQKVDEVYMYIKLFSSFLTKNNLLNM